MVQRRIWARRRMPGWVAAVNIGGYLFLVAVAVTLVMVAYAGVESLLAVFQ